MTTATAFPIQLKQVQRSGEDFEWYPTTNEIISAFTKDIRRFMEDNYRRRNDTFLDIGAGNGKVIAATESLSFIRDRFAIEKSSVLLHSLPPEVRILGVDFWNTSLIGKDVGIIFSNPPYSRYAEWSSKIIREAQAGALIYLVIPERWEKCLPISEEIRIRKAEATTVGNFDFLSSEDRTARAKVQLVRIEISEEMRSGDPFERYFDETFSYPETDKDALPEYKGEEEEADVVRRLNFIEGLVRLYQLRLERLQRNYQAVCAIDPCILAEFEIFKAGLISSLSMKLTTAKKEYWQRLFDGMDEIKRRLTHKSRGDIVSLMQAQTGIDFNRENAYEIVFWVIKNANQYFDQQFIATYEHLISLANVENYASNTRVFKRDRFRYGCARDIGDEASHYRIKVGHRIVLESSGGLERGYSWQRGISERATNFIGDLLTVARNLGFNVTSKHPVPYEWDDSDTRFYLFEKDGKSVTLFKLRAFLNRNIHIHFHPDLVHAMNIQHGRLKGWLRNDDEAAAELEISIAIAAKHFKQNFRLTANSLSITRTPDPEPEPPTPLPAFDPSAEEVQSTLF